jgi:hypothetical protein
VNENAKSSEMGAFFWARSLMFHITTVFWVGHDVALPVHKHSNLLFVKPDDCIARLRAPMKEKDLSNYKCRRTMVIRA